ncbi:MAG: hypothetical protein HUJ11_01165 [Arenibacter algicola]|nr:hypothetical protein [Arenibacter algicola]
MSIKELIETDFDYFLWLPRNINGFTYTKDVLGYAEKCLKFLEILQTYTDNTSSKIGYALGQVRIMLRYESLLDSGQDESLMMAYKSMVDVDFYRTIHNKPLENFIRQYFRKMNYSREHRRKYFLEILK